VTKLKRSHLTRLAFLGDVMLGRRVNERLKCEVPAYPWGDTLSVLTTCDWRCLNLECVLSDVRGNAGPGPAKILRFRSDAGNVAALQAASIDAVSLANNHVLDFGEEALEDMRRVLSAAGISHSGAGRDLEAASKSCLGFANGLRIAFVAFTDNVPEWAASTEKPGIFHVSADTAGLFDRIATARREADVVVVSAHWGPNWGLAVPRDHVKLAHDMIDVGADIIFGHSPHVYRGVEIYNGYPILYSTGAFIDDFAVSPVDRNDHSFVFVVELDGTGLSAVTMIPTVVRNCQARRANGEEARGIADAMIGRCVALGSSVHAGGDAIGSLELRRCGHGN
jgi:poly-gamma-glutamate capsule biosynthesis protein CapA/YwtB (metallophosphatase superfamily)